MGGLLLLFLGGSTLYAARLLLALLLLFLGGSLETLDPTKIEEVEHCFCYSVRLMPLSVLTYAVQMLWQVLAYALVCLLS
jgi:hypothetical protein